MSKLSKRVDELEAAFKNIMEVGVRCSGRDCDLEAKVATLQKQMSCDCSKCEVVFRDYEERRYIACYGIGSYYKKVCPDCGLETVYDSDEDAMKDKDALLKAEIDRLTAERKSLKDK
jgi:hypothetical protein